MSDGFYQWRDGVLELKVYVQPRASRTEVVGEHDGALKIRLAAPPVDGAANTALLKFLAKAFGVPRSRVELLAGQTGRIKRLRIHEPLRRPNWLPT